ncbi:MAG: AzlC family ABC transporter permease [Legionella sp.]|nr:AzlC family ABC transporter permease [Legionella sp.]
MNYLSTEFKQAFYVTNPTLFAYFPLGMVFGVLFTHANFTWYLAPVMSALMYAGAVQFVALSMMINHSSIAAILLATSFVALRNSFYGLSVNERFKKIPFFTRAFLIFGLVDASYAIFTARPPRSNENDTLFCFYTTLLPYLYWVVGTFIGAYYADIIPEIKGMDFILTCFFFLFVIEYYWVKKALDALIIPVLASLTGYFLLPQYYLLIAILICIFYLYLKVRVEK